jgi:hypothetical protein
VEVFYPASTRELGLLSIFHHYNGQWRKLDLFQSSGKGVGTLNVGRSPSTPESKALYIIHHQPFKTYLHSYFWLKLKILYSEIKLTHGCSVAQKVSHRLSTAAAQVRTRIRSYGICGGQRGTRAGSLRVLRCPLPSIPQMIPHSSSFIIIPGLSNNKLGSTPLHQLSYVD